MSWWLRIPLGVACLVAGGALLAWNGAAIALTLMHSGGGMALPTLGGLLLGLAGLGACADCFGWLRSRGAEQKENIAMSKWATRADIERAGIHQKALRAAPETEAGKEGIYLAPTPVLDNTTAAFRER